MSPDGKPAVFGGKDGHRIRHPGGGASGDPVVKAGRTPFLAVRTAVLAACAFVLGAPVLAAPLPGGANSLNESYQDWNVICSTGKESTYCGMSQVRNDPKTGKRVLAVELRISQGELNGVLLMPFGLALDKGLSLQADDGDKGPALRFSTCQPFGCIVPIQLDEKLLPRLKSGKTLNVVATASDSGKPITFGLSLNGFSAALARLGDLAS